MVMVADVCQGWPLSPGQANPISSFTGKTMYADQCKPDWEELLANLDYIYTGVHALAGVLDHDFPRCCCWDN